MATSWNEGYIADLAYTHGFYRELTPAMLSFAALARGQKSPDPKGPLRYCELGCGQGVTTNILAAANPQIEFHATDFNPAQIVGAQALAMAAGTPNVHFYDHSFAEFADKPDLPSFDIISLHGIYSWISPENRRHIVDFIRRKLKPGGLVYISYNTLPGWAAAMPLRRLLVDHAETGTGPILPRVDEALAFADKLLACQAKYFHATTGLNDRLVQIKEQNRQYLAHEYFNRHWTPFYHADVAAELADAKLGWIASANLLDHVDGINLTADQQKLLAGIADTTRRETTRDYIVNRQFRRDVFVKGAVALQALDVREQWKELRLALSERREDIPLKVSGAIGNADLQQNVYAPILDALRSEPKTVRQILDAKAVADLGWGRLQEALTVLIGAGHVQPCLDAEGDGTRAERTRAFNSTVLEKARGSGELAYLASPVTGGGIPLDRISQLLLLARQSKHADPVQFVWSILKAQGQKLVKQGKSLETETENLAELTQLHGIFEEKRLQILVQLGIA